MDPDAEASGLARSHVGRQRDPLRVRAVPGELERFGSRKLRPVALEEPALRRRVFRECGAVELKGVGTVADGGAPYRRSMRWRASELPGEKRANDDRRVRDYPLCIGSHPAGAD